MQNYSAGVPAYAYLIKKTKSKSVAVISYGPSITSSYDACNTTATDLKKAGFNVSYEDLGAQLGGSYTSAVQRMQQAGTQFVVSCMQESDNITMARDIQQYGLKIHQLWLSGYDQTLLDQYSDLMQGVYFNLSGNVPFEAAGSRFGNTYPGMQTYLKEMNKYEPAFTYNGVALQGWQSAALLAQAIKLAGNDLTQANLINITNKHHRLHRRRADHGDQLGELPPKTTYPTCSAFVQVKGKKFVPVFGKGKQVFVCVGPSAKNTTPVAAPAGTPGT